MSEVTVENLPDDTEDELMFGECPVGITKTLSFSLVNHGMNTVKFEWKPHPDFTLVPAAGHIQPRSTIDVKISFRTNEPKQLKSLPLTCKVQNTSIELRANVVADYAKYECKVPEIRYKNTLMYQTRSFSLPVKNTSNSSMQLMWNIDLLEAVLDEDDEKPPFTISPSTATIAAGETCLFNVTFAPLEAGDFRARLLGKIPYLHVRNSFHRFVNSCSAKSQGVRHSCLCCVITSSLPL